MKGFVALAAAMLALVLFMTGGREDTSSIDSSYCSTTNLLVKRMVASQLGANVSFFRSEKPCQVSGSGQVRTVSYAYSTPITRRNGNPPVSYTATVAHDPAQDMFYLCRVMFDDGSVETPSSHHLCSLGR